GDGQHVLFTSDREGDSAIYWQRADGSGSPERLTRPAKGTTDAPNAWAPRSQAFSFVAIQRNATDNDIWLYSLPDKKAAPLIAMPSSNQGSAMFSIDERWIAYESNESGRYEVYVQPYPPTGAKFQITREGGHHPLWSRDGKELLFVRNSRLFSVNF